MYSVQMECEIKGVGCDLVSVLRIEKLIQNKKFLNKVYTLKEQKYIKNRSAQTAAGLWAAKEAVSKVFGTGFTEFGPRDIEVLHTDSGQPEIVLHNGAVTAAEKLKIKKIYISISHEKEQAMAFAAAD